ncbi:MAG: penicillin acylase family protein [Spirochaetaceae bacterium]
MTVGKRILIAVAVVLVINIIGATTAFFIITRRAHPKTRGEVTVGGLDAPVEVLRDENGIPHIFAETTRDMYFAQGYVHAQDRFWQMDFWRRIGAGRLSELLGSATLSTDVFLRTMGFSELARQEYQAMAAGPRAALDAYARGVNAYIGDRTPGRVSLEHGLLALQGVEVEIEPWKPEHTLTWLKIMSYDLGQNLQTELDTLALVRAVGTELAAEFFPAYREDMPYIVSAAELERHLGDELIGAIETEGPEVANGAFVAGGLPLQGLAFGRGPGLGSNSWVIGGSRTADGMPILANDPHLGIQMPSIWYQVSLHSSEEELGVAGFSFPGAPGVIVGHNNRIGWGVTNLAPDVQDLYIEQINPENPTEYRVGGAWREMDVRTERIEIAGREEPHVIRVRETRNGPVITDLASHAQFRGFGVETPSVRAEGLELAELTLRWTALEPNRTFESVYRLNRAENFDEFRDAVSLFDVPAQNFVYADIDGNIGYQAPGLIPIRRAGTGRLPAPGWDDAYQWDGYIPFEELPYLYNPEKDYIVTANNPVVPDTYAYLINTEFSHGYRARRIVDLIEEAGTSIDVAAVEAMHADSFNILFDELRPFLLDSEPAQQQEPHVAEAIDVLRAWDGRMVRDSAGAAVFAMFFQHLVENLFLDQIPPELWVGSARLSEGSRVQSAVQSLLSRPHSGWWDDVRTPDTRETREDILRRALDEALAEGQRIFDAPVSEWRWGEIHTAEFRNQSLGESGIGFIEQIFNRGPVAVDGGMEQVQSTNWDMREPYEVSLLSSMRLILDFSSLDAARTMHTTGQSGHPFHRHYDDMIDDWAEVDYNPHYFSRNALEAAGVRRLELAPAE